MKGKEVELHIMAFVISLLIDGGINNPVLYRLTTHPLILDL